MTLPTITIKRRRTLTLAAMLRVDYPGRYSLTEAITEAERIEAE